MASPYFQRLMENINDPNATPEEKEIMKKFILLNVFLPLQIEPLQEMFNKIEEIERREYTTLINKIQQLERQGISPQDVKNNPEIKELVELYREARITLEILNDVIKVKEGEETRGKKPTDFSSFDTQKPIFKEGMTPMEKMVVLSSVTSLVIKMLSGGEKSENDLQDEGLKVLSYFQYKTYVDPRTATQLNPTITNIYRGIEGIIMAGALKFKPDA